MCRRQAIKGWAALLALALAASPALAALSLQVDGQLIVDQLTKLATFSDDPNPAVSRILFTGGQAAAGSGGSAGPTCIVLAGLPSCCRALLASPMPLTSC